MYYYTTVIIQTHHIVYKLKPQCLKNTIVNYLHNPIFLKNSLNNYLHKSIYTGRIMQTLVQVELMQVLIVVAGVFLVLNLQLQQILLVAYNTEVKNPYLQP